MLMVNDDKNHVHKYPENLALKITIILNIPVLKDKHQSIWIPDPLPLIFHSFF